jgi:hypothetical protein
VAPFGYNVARKSTYPTMRHVANGVQERRLAIPEYAQARMMYGAEKNAKRGPGPAAWTARVSCVNNHPFGVMLCTPASSMVSAQTASRGAKHVGIVLWVRQRGHEVIAL